MSASTLAAVLSVALLAQDPAVIQTVTPAHTTPAAPERKLELTFDLQGRVTLVAKNVSIAEILAEWGRKGGTRIQGTLAGGPIQIPMLFENRPELEVIEALTRQAAGVSVAPRRVGTTGASRFETIYILATSSATQQTPYASAPTMAPPQGIRGFPDEEIAPIVPPGAMQGGQPQAPPPAARGPATPGGSAIVPVVPVPTTTTGRGRGGGG